MNATYRVHVTAQGQEPPVTLSHTVSPHGNGRQDELLILTSVLSLSHRSMAGWGGFGLLGLAPQVLRLPAAFPGDVVSHDVLAINR
jgi:hypothetical protein